MPLVTHTYMHKWCFVEDIQRPWKVQINWRNDKHQNRWPFSDVILLVVLVVAIFHIVSMFRFASGIRMANFPIELNINRLEHFMNAGTMCINSSSSSSSSRIMEQRGFQVYVRISNVGFSVSDKLESETKRSGIRNTAIQMAYCTCYWLKIHIFNDCTAVDVIHSQHGAHFLLILHTFVMHAFERARTRSYIHIHTIVQSTHALAFQMKFVPS